MSELVTVPGTHNVAMGCPGNWQPDCARAALSEQSDGRFAGTFDLPGGDYEYKVAIGGGWDANYGADGQWFGPNIVCDWAGGAITFRYDPSTHLAECTAGGGVEAQWVRRQIVLIPADSPQLSATQRRELSWDLHCAPSGGQIVGVGLLPNRASRLAVTELPADVALKFPALAGYLALAVEQPAVAEEALTGQLLVVGTTAAGEVRYISGVQIPGVLDDLYAERAVSRVFGADWSGRTPTLTVWAPTAKQVKLLLWPGADVSIAPQQLPMSRGADGSWVAVGDPSWVGAAYQYRITVYAPSTARVEINEVTDPYSVALTVNSTHSVLVDLNDPRFQPERWLRATPPAVPRTVDRTIYELHVRDFSVADQSVPAEFRGRYAAFTVADSAGVSHLRALAAAGLNTVHLLPTFDFSSVPEAADQHTTLDLTHLPADSAEQQALIAAIADNDPYNWGYDPFHWQTPEGSYATPADEPGGARLAEFRSMVGALHEIGLQVVLDQVYNHTAAAGQAEKSLLDRVVPGYYHRLCAVGLVENSTCCFNVATEHALAEKLMVDSIVLWARHYRVDGFRFDLMGHHSKANLLATRAALDVLTTAADGVDGREIYLYGEGWNFGEVADDALFVQARQGNLGGTGIGTFNDRLRDAVHGGGSSDAEQRVQGFGTGLFTDPNDVSRQDDMASQLSWLRHLTDLVQLGLAGNLRSFVMRCGDGRRLRGDQLDYNGQAAGYADQPDEVVNYVDAHDNQTLFDILTLRLSGETSMADRVRMNTVCLATVALSQSASFWQAGTDILRSKSFDVDSYNSGDWFNSIDWTGQHNGFGRGLPPASRNLSRWPTQREFLGDPTNRPAPVDIAAAAAAARELLRLRASTPLFRLGSAELIRDRLQFPISGPSAEPGVILMSIDDTVSAGGTVLDAQIDAVIVVFNATPHPITQTAATLAGREFILSPIQAAGADPVVVATTWDAATGTVSVPGRTVAVLVQPS